MTSNVTVSGVALVPIAKVVDSDTLTKSEKALEVVGGSRGLSHRTGYNSNSAVTASSGKVSCLATDRMGWLLAGTTAGYIHVVPLTQAASKAAASFVGLSASGTPIVSSASFALQSDGIGGRGSGGSSSSSSSSSSDGSGSSSSSTLFSHREHRVTHNNNYYVSSGSKKGSNSGGDVTKSSQVTHLEFLPSGVRGDSGGGSAEGGVMFVSACSAGLVRLWQLPATDVGQDEGQDDSDPHCSAGAPAEGPRPPTGTGRARARLYYHHHYHDHDHYHKWQALW